MDPSYAPLNNVESAQVDEPAPPPSDHVSQGSVPVIVGTSMTIHFLLTQLYFTKFV